MARLPAAGRASSCPRPALVRRRRVPRTQRRRRAAPLLRAASRSGRSADEPSPCRRRLPTRSPRPCSAGASRRRATSARPRAPIPPELEVALPEYDETLAPDLRRPRARPADGRAAVAAAHRACSTGRGPRRASSAAAGGWQATPHGRFERLLRETRSRSACSSTARACGWSPPRAARARAGSTSPSRDDDRGGRPADLRRAAAAARRAPPVRAAARAAARRAPRREPQVPERGLDQLAEQVLPRCTSCSAASRRPTTRPTGELLRDVLADDPDEVYAGLLTVLLRLVFLLYAEDRGCSRATRSIVRYYSVAGPVRAAPRGRRPLPRHDGPALRRVGAAARRSSGWSTTAARHGDAAAARPPRLPVRPRPLPVPGRPAAGGDAPDRRADRAAARVRRRGLPRAREPAHPRRRADLATGRSTSSRSARSTRR